MMFRFAFEKLFKAREAANRKRHEHLRPGADDGFDPYEKPFLDHLEDLRKTLMKMIIVLLVATILTFYFNVEIFNFIQLPAKIAKTDQGQPLWELIDFLTLSPPEILTLSIKTAFIAAVILSFPLLVWYAGEFILPGLKQNEKRYVVPGVGIGFVLFLIGASFAFFVAVPVALKFFYEFYLDRVGILKSGAAAEAHLYVPVRILPGFEEPKPAEAKSDAEPETKTDTKPETAAKEESAAKIESAAEVESTTKLPEGVAELGASEKAAIRHYIANLIVAERGSKLGFYYDPKNDKLILTNDTVKMVNYRIGEYISFVTRLVLVFGISFELPIVVVILVKLELLTGRVMRNTRSYAFVAILVIAAVLTPTPDVLTMSLLAGPLVVLYEICIWIAWWIERAREKAQIAEEREREARYALLLEKPSDELTDDERAEIQRREKEQYDRDHAHLYIENQDHVAHDPYHDHYHHDDPYHDPYHDPYGHPIEHDTNHDESWDAPHRAVTESDHVAGKDTETESESDMEASHYEDEYQTCEPDGPVILLNSSSEEDIMTLPGVDPELARLLVQHRPYHTFDDLMRVPGITNDKLYDMMDRLSIDDPDADHYLDDLAVEEPPAGDPAETPKSEDAGPGEKGNDKS